MLFEPLERFDTEQRVSMVHCRSALCVHFALTGSNIVERSRWQIATGSNLCSSARREGRFRSCRPEFLGAFRGRPEVDDT